MQLLCAAESSISPTPLPCITLCKLCSTVRSVASCKPGKPGLTSFSETLAPFFIQFLSFRKMKVQDRQKGPSKSFRAYQKKKLASYAPDCNVLEQGTNATTHLINALSTDSLPKALSEGIVNISHQNLSWKNHPTKAKFTGSFHLSPKPWLREEQDSQATASVPKTR